MYNYADKKNLPTNKLIHHLDGRELPVGEAEGAEPAEGVDDGHRPDQHPRHQGPVQVAAVAESPEEGCGYVYLVQAANANAPICDFDENPPNKHSWPFDGCLLKSEHVNKASQRIRTRLHVSSLHKGGQQLAVWLMLE